MARIRNFLNKYLSKLNYGRKSPVDSEPRIGVYKEVHENPSTGSTYKSPAETAIPKRSKLKANLFIFLLTPIAFIAPDFICKLFNQHNQTALSGKFILGMAIFSLFLSFSPRIFIVLILMIFIIIEIIQFCHLFYYNSLLTSAKISLLFEEFLEVWQVAGEAISFLYLVPLIVLAPYFTLIFCLFKLEKLRFKSIFAILPSLIILLIIPYRVNQAYNGVNYYPDPADHSLRNSLYAFSNFLLNQYTPNAKANIKYQDYEIKETYSDKANIILIIGESVNPKHMSLFGYNKDTNPLLSKLKTDPNFLSLRSISGAVSTIVSLPVLLNGIYEPNNYDALEKTPANLFKLAKLHDYKTFYISAQSGALLTNIGSQYIDYLMFNSKDPILFAQHQDQALLKIIDKLEYGENNFVVLHQRNIHAPYEANYAKYPEFDFFKVNRENYQQFLTDTYDNATRYNDYLIYKMIDFFRNKFSKHTYIFFTSDHGEALGAENIYGHSFLHPEIYSIPFLAYLPENGIIKPKHLMNQEPICHYQVHNLIASIIGFEIINPNLRNNICYIQGTNLYGLNEYLEYDKSK